MRNFNVLEEEKYFFSLCGGQEVLRYYKLVLHVRLKY